MLSMEWMSSRTRIEREKLCNDHGGRFERTLLRGDYICIPACAPSPEVADPPVAREQKR